MSLIVQPGDQLEVSDDVAAQLLAASGQFKDTDAAKPEPADEPDERPKRKTRAKKSAAKGD